MGKEEVLLFGALWVHPGYYDRFKRVFTKDETLVGMGIALERLNPHRSLLVFSIDPDQRKPFIDYFTSQFRFTRSFQRLAWINPLHCSETVDEMFEQIIKKATKRDPCTYRLEFYPRWVRDSLLPKLLDTPLPLCHKDYTDVISVFLWPKAKFSKTKYPDRPSRNEFYLGIFSRDEQVLNSPDARREDSAVCSARYKIQECVEHCLPQSVWENEIHHVIDIGAAPGGWTGFLLEKGKRVAAVDPAIIDLIKPSDDWIHIQKVVQDGQEELKRFHESYDLLVCDMNRDPIEASSLCLEVAPLLRSGGWFILTLKLPNKPSKKEIRQAENNLRKKLEPDFHVTDVAWLFANTLNERTLIAHKK